MVINGREIALEDIPFESFKKRLRAGELGTPDLNDSNRRLYGLPSQFVVREAFVADRATVLDSFQGETVHQRKLSREGF